MQLYALSVPAFTPKFLIEGYSSLIWGEKYLLVGEFELVTAQGPVADSIPPGTLLCIEESTEVMMVETRNRRQNPEGYPESVITGRSVDAILDERLILGPHGAALITPRKYTNLDIALVCIWNALCNTTIDDALYGGAGGRPAVIVQDSPIPNVSVTDSTTVTPGTASNFSLNLGQAGGVIRQFLANNSLGIRTIRPTSKDTSKLVSVATSPPASRGIITKTPTSSFASLRLDVFNGTDRTQGQIAVPPVTFVASAGHLVNTETLESDKDFVTTLFITTPEPGQYGYTTPYNHPSQGFSTKIRYVDGTQLITGLTGVDISTIISLFTSSFWIEHAGRALLDGDISDSAPYKYGVDYFLGDAVTLQYNNLTRTVWVSEYTRAEDKDGERSYPTLATTPSSATRGLQRL
jgi:hypothetical protein